MAPKESCDALGRIFNHVFLPPKLPGGEDDCEWMITLSKHLLRSFHDFRPLAPEEDRPALDIAIASVTIFEKLIDSNGHIQENALKDALNFIIENVYIKEQNAGLVVRREKSTLYFEAFGLSARDQDVLAAKGRLRRHFPSAAVSMTKENFAVDDFQSAMAATITKMSHQVVAEMKPTARKAGKSHVEDRDTTDPSMVTQFLLSTLRALGQPAQVQGLWKNTREEVMYCPGNRLPWRRSPVWLLLRVVLQRVLSQSRQACRGDDLYKEFMVFFMSQLLECAVASGFSSETLYTMNAKIARRLTKLNIQGERSWMLVVQRALKQSTNQLDQRWHSVLKSEELTHDLSRIMPNNMDDELDIKLPGLDTFVKEISERTPLKRDNSFIPHSCILKFPQETLPSASFITADDYGHLQLAAFENWVAKHLDAWLAVYKADSGTCFQLRAVIEAYHEAATRLYQGKPEGSSIQILTILELWVACDKSAIQIHPILAEYDPDISSLICQALLLKSYEEMERLSAVAKYLERRGKAHNKTVHTGFGDPSSFSVRYFAASSTLWDKKTAIESEARDEQDAKREELGRLRQRYRDLILAYNSSQCDEHEFIDLAGNLQSWHDRDCSRCALKEEADGMEIRVHEWPLPQNELQAQSTVFEMYVPKAFSGWRDTTSFLRDTVLGYEGACDTQYYYCSLSSYMHLDNTLQENQWIVLASSTKPHVATHRSERFVSTVEEDDVCLENGLQWAYYNDHKRGYLQQGILSDKVSRLCTFSLAGSLREFLARPWSRPDGLDPNTVLARQAQCPPNLSIDEYKAMCSLPLGHRILWRNILVQLAMPDVDWRKLETVLIVWQISHQTGPPSTSVHGASHQVLQDDKFISRMLECLSKSLARLKENWESSAAVSVFAVLATRLLSLSSPSKWKDCLNFLRECRQACSKWLKTLRERMEKKKNDASTVELCQRALQVALIGSQTFDVDRWHLTTVLQCAESSALYLDFCISVRDTLHCFKGDARHRIPALDIIFFDALLLRHHGLTFRAYPALIKEIVDKGNRCLNTAVRNAWQLFIPQGPWKVKADCWLTTTSAKDGVDDPLSVHFNVATAELLVNGLPVARLPQAYEIHKTYHTLIGQRPIEVMPTKEPGMKFEANKLFKGHQLYFSLEDRGLQVRAEKNGQAWDFVPPDVFGSSIPKAFVEDYVHWFDIANNAVECRTKKNPWVSSEASWRLSRAGSGWRLWHGDISLLSPSKPVATRLSSIFKPLTDLSGLHLLYNERTSCLEVDIPRLKLQFDILPGSSSINSRQYRGMCIDERQSGGTLIGLQHKMFLHKVDDYQQRMVLIPVDKPQCYQTSIAPSASHVRINIGYDAEQVEAYYCEGHLGRLVGNGSLPSKLFLAELHALTSSCLPDPFTNQTGTEEALTIIRSEGVRSFDRLSENEISLLHRLACLSPRRSYYPEHLRVMQVVSWNSSLSYLSQHGSFNDEVLLLLEQAEKTAFFYTDTSVLTKVEHPVPDKYLSGRDAIRSSALRASGFGAEDFSTKFDRGYSDSVYDDQWGSRAARASMVAWSVINPNSGIPFSMPKNATTFYYRLFSSQNSTFASKSGVEVSEFRYDSYWLQDPLVIFKERGLKIHHAIAQHIEALNRFQLMMWLATVAISENSSDEILKLLIGFTHLKPLHDIAIPRVPARGIRLIEGFAANKTTIRELLETHKMGFIKDRANIQPLRRESKNQAYRRLAADFNEKQRNVLTSTTDLIHSLWPTPTYLEYEIVQLHGNTFGIYFRQSALLKKTKSQFQSWTDNKAFRQYLNQVCTVLSIAPSISCKFNTPLLQKMDVQARKVLRHVSLKDVLSLQLAPDMKSDIQVPQLTKSISKSSENRISALVTILESQAKSKQDVRYVKQLRESAAQLQCHFSQDVLSITPQMVQETLQDYHASSLEHYNQLLGSLQRLLGGYQCTQSWSDVSTSFSTTVSTHHWPRISAKLLISQLNRYNWSQLSEPWKKAIVELGCALTQLQASERLIAMQHREVDLCKELRNLQPRSWDPLEDPDSLLLEIEGNLRIREVQDRIASTMKHPPDDENAVMQLNMGEGKSSVIVPVVAASLADGSRLVRVIVAKPQSRQMFEMLVSKLGGMIGRRVYHMPFSRSLRITQGQANFIKDYFDQCRLQGGVLLLQPENILSFQLMVIETFIKGEKDLGQILLKTQIAYDQTSRDIVDESDENFSAKFELIYTMGQQTSIDFAPDRWNIIHQILKLIAKYTPNIEAELPKSIELEDPGDGRFPRIRFLDESVVSKVLELVVDHICKNGLIPGFSVTHQPSELRDSLKAYILDPNPPEETIHRVETSEFWSVSQSSLLLIRGLFSSGLLEFVFGKKRWRVNYGLDSTRQPSTRLAVPYQAKDKPSLRSEFSHPDVVICLTSLTYYYGGLSDEDLFVAFAKLSRSDQADREYEDWVATAAELPESFRHLQGINIRDEEQCRSIVFPALKFSTGAIDYFLSRIVFAKEMKEFPEKLSASGWDIGKVKTNPTTGFSGTNDSRMLLPANMKQLGLESQKHTNALVLEYLLGDENLVHLLSNSGHHGACGGIKLLQTITKISPEIRVILDVGAQIVELRNEEVARTWLDLFPAPDKIQAAIFCNDTDDLCVVDRSGRVERLQTSSFAKQLDVCLVYLDEAHTRGIDLQLPLHYRAAVTLGASLVKDRLVQACMRMRKLGQGQSITFIVPSEIETKIQKMKNLDQYAIQVLDVLAWTIHETWADIRRTIPIWDSQGRTFVKQKGLWKQALASKSDNFLSEDLTKSFLEDEAQSIETRYRPRLGNPTSPSNTALQDTLLASINDLCADFEDLDMNSSSLQEEQERELSPEIEQERQRQLAPPAEPRGHEVHTLVRQFVQTGNLQVDKRAFLPAFLVFDDTTAAADFDAHQWPPGLLITQDFARTAQATKGGKNYMDDFQRGVQWILTSKPAQKRPTRMVVLSPFEANALTDEITKYNQTTLHIYAPRQNLSFAPIDHLRLYSVPSSTSPQDLLRRLIIELNLFAGQLYFNSFTEYTDVCEYLGLAWKADMEGVTVSSDGFILQRSPGSPVNLSKFKTSPVSFLRTVLMKIRRNTEGIEKTHLGKILNGAPLIEEDFAK